MIPFLSPSLPPPLASLSDFPNLGESLKFQVNGLVVVFVALILIWSLVTVMGWAFRLHARVKHLEGSLQPAPLAPTPSASPPAVSVAPVSVAPSLPVAPAASELTPEIIAIITAAVHVALAGVPHRIQSIAPFGAGIDWAREGRRNIFASHQPR